MKRCTTDRHSVDRAHGTCASVIGSIHAPVIVHAPNQAWLRE